MMNRTCAWFLTGIQALALGGPLAGSPAGPEGRANWHEDVFFGIHYDLHANAKDTELGKDLTPEHRRERRLDEFDLRRGGRVKVVSQRNTRAVDHHHPLRPLAPLGFSDSAAPFFAGAKLPSKKASLQFNCWRSFNSPRKVRQISSQIPCSSQSPSRRQQVEGDGNSSGISCQRTPLRRIHKMPSSTLRSLAGGRLPRGRGGRLGSKGRIFFHWASVSNRPYRAIGPPSGAAHFRDPPPRENNYPKFSPLYRVLNALRLRWARASAILPRAKNFHRAFRKGELEPAIAR